MAAGIAFLQAEFEDQAPGPPGGQAFRTGLGNTDIIRQMLREQQRSMGALHANALFREFRGAGKGQLVGLPEIPAVDDFQAEGQARLFELIRQTALKDEKPLRGVWASFGKPYICLGDPQEPSGRLPALHRDEIASMEKAKKEQRTGAVKQKKAAAAQPADATAAAGGGSPPGSPHQQPPGTAGSRPGTRGSRGGSARRIGTAASLASLESTLRPEEVLELRLNKIKTVMRFANNDVTEASFPQAPLQQAAARRTRIKASPGSFVNPESASREVADPSVAYGHAQKFQQELRPPQLTAPKEESSVVDQRSTVFITQGTSHAPYDDDGMHRRSYGGGGMRRSSMGYSERPHLSQEPWEGARQGPGDVLDSNDAMAGAGDAPHPASIYKPMVDEAVPMRGDEDNPVYSWHNSFLRVRQAGRASLQAALYQRAEGRFRARTVGPMAANLSSILMSDLDLVKGRQVPYATLGIMPASPYAKMDKSWAELQERAAHAARVASQLDPEELRLLQRFYDQLCALVEAQRMSDPLLLMVVHKVKGLLEEGTFLQRVMFEAVVGHIGRFVAATGIRKHNKYLLSVFTFIAKCTGVNEAEFESLVVQAGLCQVVYNTPFPPSQMHAPSHSIDELQSSGGKMRRPRSHANSGGSKSPPRRGPSGAVLQRMNSRMTGSFAARNGAASFTAGSPPALEVMPSGVPMGGEALHEGIHEEEHGDGHEMGSGQDVSSDGLQQDA